jgi:hypothetical protein
MLHGAFHQDAPVKFFACVTHRAGVQSALTILCDFVIEKRRFGQLIR